MRPLPEPPGTRQGLAPRYVCPMDPEVASAEPGSCPKCGMALERNPAYREPARTIWTCPMHPEVQRDRAGACPICGMALEPKFATGAEENHELVDLTRRLWIGATLALPVFVLGMLHTVPSLAHIGQKSFAAAGGAARPP